MTIARIGSRQVRSPIYGLDETGSLLWIEDIPVTREANGRSATNAPLLAGSRVHQTVLALWHNPIPRRRSLPSLKGPHSLLRVRGRPTQLGCGMENGRFETGLARMILIRTPPRSPRRGTRRFRAGSVVEHPLHVEQCRLLAPRRQSCRRRRPEAPPADRSSHHRRRAEARSDGHNEAED